MLAVKRTKKKLEKVYKFIFSLICLLYFCFDPKMSKIAEGLEETLSDCLICSTSDGLNFSIMAITGKRTFCSFMFPLFVRYLTMTFFR